MRKRIFILRALSKIARLIGRVVGYWKLALIALFFLSDTGPHLRVEYTYRGTSDPFGQRSYTSCTYLGSRGFVTPAFMVDCPIIAIFDASEVRRKP